MEAGLESGGEWRESQAIVIHLEQMCNTVTVRLPDELIEWLRTTAAQTGVSQSSIIRSQLEKVRALEERPFLRLAGQVSGHPGLSLRKGFSEK